MYLMNKVLFLKFMIYCLKLKNKIKKIMIFLFKKNYKIFDIIYM